MKAAIVGEHRGGRGHAGVRAEGPPGPARGRRARRVVGQEHEHTPRVMGFASADGPPYPGEDALELAGTRSYPRHAAHVLLSLA